MCSRRIARLLLLAPLLAPSAGAAAETDILAVSPEMERFIEARVRPDQARSARVRGLLDALFGGDGLDISYGSGETKTAVETFETGSGNCLSFTLLFVALARHLGLEAEFFEVGEILSWDRRGDVAVSNRHMFAEIETMEGTTRVDFLPGVEKRYRQVRRVDERRVQAHYFSNLGAEALTRDQLERAEELFARALETDDTLAAAWVNLGVTHRRQGRLEAAEAAYLKAMELDPHEISAAYNLAGLYRAAGQARRAEPYLQRVRRHRRTNPFWHFRRGLAAKARGELVIASRRLRQAIRLMPDDAMFRVELGKVQALAGKPRRAARSYRRALVLADDEEQRRVIEELLRRVRDDPAWPG